MNFVRKSLPLLVLLPLVLTSCTGCYLARQGLWVLRYQGRARPVEKVLADSSASDSVRAMLDLSLRVRRFAIERIGLAPDRNFTTFVAVPGKRYLLDVVCACAADTFRQYTWRFPFFGSFPYKGFFVRADALREADRLRARGLDVLVRGAGAFSSLGFLRDPLYSFMKEWPAHEIASVIIHEQAHATLFVRNRVEFNEQFATFVGDQGALEFVRETFGDTSAQWREALAARHDDSTFMALVRGLHARLDSAYRILPGRRERLDAKQRIVAGFTTGLLESRDTFFLTESYRRGWAGLKVDNAWVLSYMTYVKDLGLFQRLYESHGRDLRQTVAVLKTLCSGTGDPFEGLRKKVESIKDQEKG